MHYSCVKAKGKETIIIFTQRDLNFVAWKEALQFFNCFPLMNSSWFEVHLIWASSSSIDVLGWRLILEPKVQQTTIKRAGGRKEVPTLGTWCLVNQRKVYRRKSSGLLLLLLCTVYDSQQHLPSFFYRGQPYSPTGIKYYSIRAVTLRSIRKQNAYLLLPHLYNNNFPKREESGITDSDHCSLIAPKPKDVSLSIDSNCRLVD